MEFGFVLRDQKVVGAKLLKSLIVDGYSAPLPLGAVGKDISFGLKFQTKPSIRFALDSGPMCIWALTHPQIKQNFSIVAWIDQQERFRVTVGQGQDSKGPLVKSLPKNHLPLKVEFEKPHTMLVTLRDPRGPEDPKIEGSTRGRTVSPAEGLARVIVHIDGCVAVDEPMAPFGLGLEDFEPYLSQHWLHVHGDGLRPFEGLVDEFISLKDTSLACYLLDTLKTFKIRWIPPCADINTKRSVTITMPDNDDDVTAVTLQAQGWMTLHEILLKISGMISAPLLDFNVCENPSDPELSHHRTTIHAIETHHMRKSRGEPLEVSATARLACCDFFIDRP